jgi:hypothetical protein
VDAAPVNGSVDSARVIVIPVGVSCYRDPPEPQRNRGRRRFEYLAAVETDLAQITRLFGSDHYRKNGFAVLPVVSGTAGEIIDQLNRIAEDLAAEPGRTVLLFWSGHGDTPNGGELRLATTESYQPMTPADGLPPWELVNKLAASGAKCFYLILDVCQAGAAGGGIATAAAQRFRENPDSSRFAGMAALFSAQAFELAEEGLFAELFERVLREGPSAEARARIAQAGGEGIVHNRMLSMDEIRDMIEVEFDLLQERRPIVQAPTGQSMGRTFRPFPNPLYTSNAPAVMVEVARRRVLRQQDLDVHFLPKARGLEPGEEGWFFSGRDAVSQEIAEWLHGRGAAGGEALYVLTGSGGTGKSAILGRMVALSDPQFLASPSAAVALAAARNTVPNVGSIDAALHLRNLDVVAAASALSDLLGLAAPEPGRLDAWTEAQKPQLPGLNHVVTIVLDALDESAEPTAIAELLIQPLVSKGWRFLVGSRPSAASRQAALLISRLGRTHIRDLDHEPTTTEDIRGYVSRRLTQAPGSPYAGSSDDPVSAIADGIARKANGRFLFARLAVSGLMRRPRMTPSEVMAVTGDTIGEVLVRDLASTDESFRVRFSRHDAGASRLLAALAWAEGDGLPLRDDVWRIVAGALQPDLPSFQDEHVKWLLNEAGRYIIESGDGEQAVYRLFHESLNEHFRAGYDSIETGARIASALQLDIKQRGGWDDANPYIVRYLTSYYRGPAVGLERLCTDPWYLRRALELFGADRLADMLYRAYRTHQIRSIEAVAKSIKRARVALSRDPSQLAAQLQARLAGEETGDVKALIYQLPRAAPPLWLRSRGATLGWQAALQTMQTFNAKVRALAFGSIEGDGVIAVGAGAEIILWNPRMGALPARPISNDGLRVTELAIGAVEGREVLAVAAGYDQRLVVRDARTGAVIGEPVACGHGHVAIGEFKGRVIVAIPDGCGYVARTIDERGPNWAQRIQATTVGQLRGTIMAIEQRERKYRVVSLDTGECVGKEIKLPKDAVLTAIGELNGEPAVCYTDRYGNVGVLKLASGEKVASEIAMSFPVRTLVGGEIDGEFIVAAGNETDSESGYVSIRQPLTIERLSQPMDHPRWSWHKVLGVGLTRRTSGKARTLALIFERGGAVDPLTGQILAKGPRTGAIELFSGTWRAPTIRQEAPLPHSDPDHGFILRRDYPLQWPITCEAWATVGGRILHVRGSYFGTVWVIDAQDGSVVAGPFRSVGDEVRVPRGVKRAAGPDLPATGVSVGMWQGRGVVAVAYRRHAEVFDLATAERLGSPQTGNTSNIVAVAVGESENRALLATASEGGAITIWEGPSMRRIAGITLDSGAKDVWLAANVVAVRTVDDRFHVFDLASNARRTAR